MVRLARFLPKHGRVVYCLYRDPRVPTWWKASLAGTLIGVVWNPLVNLPEDIPVIGQVEVIGLTILAVRTALRFAPRSLVEEHEAALAAGTSVFHQDLRQARLRAEQLRDRTTG